MIMWESQQSLSDVSFYVRNSQRCFLSLTILINYISLEVQANQ